MREKHNFEVKSEWISESPGVCPALCNAVKVFTNEGDGVIIFSPVYYPFKNTINQTNRKVIDVPLICKGDKYYIDFDTFNEVAKSDKNKMIIFCSPHNPVGRVWTKDELKKVSDICTNNNLLMISDEIHFDLVMSGYEHTVYSTLSEEAKMNSIICTSPSKTFNLAGMQCANIIIPNPKLKEQFDKTADENGFFNLNTLAYKACELAYLKADSWYLEVLKHIENNAKIVEQFMLNNIPQIKVFPLEGTYLQWWDCRELGMNYIELEEFMTKEALLFLDEGNLFGDAGNGFERINLACPTWVLEEALRRLLDAIKKRG